MSWKTAVSVPDAEPTGTGDGFPRLLFDKSRNLYVGQDRLGQDGLTDDILGGLAFWPLIISNIEYVSVVNADELIEKSRNLPNPSAQFKKFQQSINEDSNPVVIIATKRIGYSTPQNDK